MPGGGSKKGERRGGRGKGTPNKLSADLKSMILGALDDAGGQEYLAAQAIASPAAFLTLIGKILPTQVETGPNGLTLTYVVRAPTPVNSADEWLRQHAPSDSRKLLTTDS